MWRQGSNRTFIMGQREYWSTKLVQWYFTGPACIVIWTFIVIKKMILKLILWNPFSQVMNLFSISIHLLIYLTSNEPFFNYHKKRHANLCVHRTNGGWESTKSVSPFKPQELTYFCCCFIVCFGTYLADMLVLCSVQLLDYCILTMILTFRFLIRQMNLFNLPFSFDTWPKYGVIVLYLLVLNAWPADLFCPIMWLFSELWFLMSR